MAHRIYLVTVNGGTSTRPVRAPNTVQALRHVAADTLTVAVASQDDLVRLIAAGVKVETSGDAVEAAAPAPVAQDDLVSRVSVADGATTARNWISPD